MTSDRSGLSEDMLVIALRMLLRSSSSEELLNGGVGNEVVELLDGLGEGNTSTGIFWGKPLVRLGMAALGSSSGWGEV